jgi:ppGpp synthetase/RelA/SpoT-type nucleotidyltranferase
VPLPISRTALDKLGDRLVASDDISDEDYALLADVLSAYQAALLEVQERLVALGYAPTTRTKTTGVLVEKLRRERGMKLKGVQDIAGARIVSDCDLDEQDELVRRWWRSSPATADHRRSRIDVPSPAPAIGPCTWS